MSIVLLLVGIVALALALAAASPALAGGDARDDLVDSTAGDRGKGSGLAEDRPEDEVRGPAARNIAASTRSLAGEAPIKTIAMEVLR